MIPYYLNWFDFKMRMIFILIKLCKKSFVNRFFKRLFFTSVVKNQNWSFILMHHPDFFWPILECAEEIAHFLWLQMHHDLTSNLNSWNYDCPIINIECVHSAKFHSCYILFSHCMFQLQTNPPASFHESSFVIFSIRLP